MNLTIMLLLHEFSLPTHDCDEEVDAGPNSPRPADPSPEGGEGEPVGDDDDDDEHGDRPDAPAGDVH